MRVLIIDEIHLLGDERGPVLEVIVSRTNFIASHTHQPVRVVGLSTALANAKDLADWLGIKQVFPLAKLICKLIIKLIPSFAHYVKACVPTDDYTVAHCTATPYLCRVGCSTSTQQ